MAETVIVADSWRAVVDARGCTLRSVSCGGRELLVSPPELDWSLGHHGAVLAPWPGRTLAGRYTFEGVERQLDVNEPLFGHALHGFAFDTPWRCTAADVASVTHETVLGERAGYPMKVGLRVTYRVDDHGVRCDAAWTNLGRVRAPFGLGFHPYLTVGDGPVDGWTLQVPAAVSVDSDPETKRPLPQRATTANVDFVSPRLISDERFSRGYGQLRRQDGIAVARVTAPDGFALELGVDEQFGWLQVFTADLPWPALARRGLAVEPQTCPPDAFNSGTDLQRLEPGQHSAASWFLRLAV